MRVPLVLTVLGAAALAAAAAPRIQFTQLDTAVQRQMYMCDGIITMSTRNCFCPKFDSSDYAAYADGCDPSIKPQLVLNSDASVSDAMFLAKRLVRVGEFEVLSAQILGSAVGAGAIVYDNTCHYLESQGYTDTVVLSTGTMARSLSFDNGKNSMYDTDPATDNTGRSAVGDDTLPGSQDCTALQFTVKPLFNASALITLSSLFMSKEYPEFVNNTYNDQFRFWIKESTASAWEDNLSKLPNGQVVSINSVNFMAQTSLYESCPKFSAFDGNTRSIFAHSYMMDPAKTYTFRLVVCDFGDSSYDSAVVFQAGSLARCQGKATITCPTNIKMCTAQSDYTFGWQNPVIQDDCGVSRVGSFAVTPDGASGNTQTLPTGSSETISYTFIDSSSGEQLSCSFNIEAAPFLPTLPTFDNVSFCAGVSPVTYVPPVLSSVENDCGRVFNVKRVDSYLNNSFAAPGTYQIVYAVDGYPSVTTSFWLSLTSNIAPTILSVALAPIAGQAADSVQPLASDTGYSYSVVAGTSVLLTVEISDVDLCCDTLASVVVAGNLVNTTLSLSNLVPLPGQPGFYEATFLLDVVKSGSVTITVTDCKGLSAMTGLTVTTPFGTMCTETCAAGLTSVPTDSGCKCLQLCDADMDCANPVTGVCSGSCVLQANSNIKVCAADGCDKACCKATLGRNPLRLDTLICSNGCGANSCCFARDTTKGPGRCNSLPTSPNKGSTVPALDEACSVMYGEDKLMCSSDADCAKLFPGRDPNLAKCLFNAVSGLLSRSVCSMRCDLSLASKDCPTGYGCAHFATEAGVDYSYCVKAQLFA